MLVSKKRYDEMRSERDLWVASSGTFESERDAYRRLANEATELAERFERERDEAIREGAKLADELVGLRKAPEIEGMWLSRRSGEPIYVKGCVVLSAFSQVDGEIWLDARDSKDMSLGSYILSDIIATVPVYAHPAKSTAKKRGT